MQVDFGAYASIRSVAQAETDLRLPHPISALARSLLSERSSEADDESILLWVHTSYTSSISCGLASCAKIFFGHMVSCCTPASLRDVAKRSGCVSGYRSLTCLWHLHLPLCQRWQRHSRSLLQIEYRRLTSTSSCELALRIIGRYLCLWTILQRVSCI